MIAAIEFVKMDSKRIAINVYDIVVVAEMGECTQITYVSTDREDSFITKESFQATMSRCKEAIRKWQSDPDDSWKEGGYGQDSD